MKKATAEQAVFTVHPCIEFVHALSFIANEEARYKFFSDISFAPGDEFKLMIADIKSRLSRFIQSELTYFFTLSDMEDVLLNIFLESKTVSKVPELLELMEQMQPEKLLAYITRQALLTEAADVNILKQLISDTDSKLEEDKEKLTEFVENTTEMKTRLCFLLRQFYEKCYRPLEDKLLLELTAAKERYEKLFQADPEHFNNEFLGKILARYEALIIHVSCFTQIRVRIHDVKPYENKQWTSLGVHTENYPRKAFIKSKAQKFIKILSDNKRFEIIERLAERPYYVNELSAELGLTPPTVCYHLNSMLELGLVSVDRGNNRTFYSLNKDTVKELLEHTSEILLQD